MNCSRQAVFCSLLLLLWAAAGATPHPGKPHLRDVRVWYYPPSGPPVTVIWWRPESLQMTGETTFHRGGKFRVRVEMEGGFVKGDEVVNFLSIVFRDRNSIQYQIPLSMALVKSGVRDLYWEPPLSLNPGDLEFQAALWTGTLPRLTKLTKIADRTEFLILGHLD